MTLANNLAGLRFGRLLVIERSVIKSTEGWIQWVCKCDCGKSTTVRAAKLRSGYTKSCGCLSRDMFIARSTTHGHATNVLTGTYTSWKAMHDRCKNPNCKAFHYYGGRGVVICDRWNDFANFLADMGERPHKKTLDRIDNNGNYEPNNCRWISLAEQQRNKSSNVMLTVDGITKPISAWAREKGICASTISHRVRHGRNPFVRIRFGGRTKKAH